MFSLMQCLLHELFSHIIDELFMLLFFSCRFQSDKFPDSQDSELRHENDESEHDECNDDHVEHAEPVYRVQVWPYRKHAHADW